MVAKNMPIDMAFKIKAQLLVLRPWPSPKIASSPSSSRRGHGPNPSAAPGPMSDAGRLTRAGSDRSLCNAPTTAPRRSPCVKIRHLQARESPYWLIATEPACNHPKTWRYAEIVKMYLATIGADQLVCVEKEAGEKGLHSHSATKSSPLRIVRLTDVMQRLNT